MNLHSAEYFGEARNSWWNQDFIALIAERTQLRGVTHALDVGCGVGHWSRVLSPHLSPQARLRGVDAQPRWVEIANRNTELIGGRFHAVVGSAESLPFENDTFDLVTCQTLLIHVSSPSVVLREMLRVLRPGGRLLLSEPNNLANAMVTGSLRLHQSIEERMQLVRLQAICESGKAAIGEGDNSVGELLPGLIDIEGGRNIQVWLSDKASTLIPPYESAEQRAEVSQIRDWSTRDFWIWSRNDTQRYFLAGGGVSSEFESLWQLAMHTSRLHASLLESRQLHSAGGGISYLITAVKPGPTSG